MIFEHYIILLLAIGLGAALYFVSKEKKKRRAAELELLEITFADNWHSPMPAPEGQDYVQGPYRRKRVNGIWYVNGPIFQIHQRKPIAVNDRFSGEFISKELQACLNLEHRRMKDG